MERLQWNRPEWYNGIGDEPFVLGKDNTDNYPLMKPVNVTLEIPDFPDAENSTEPESFPAVLVVTSLGTSVALVIAGLLVFYKKRKREVKLS